MNIDLTQMELAMLVKLCEATESNPVVAQLLSKANRCLSNFSTSETPLEPNASPKTASQQWRSPI